VSRVGPTSPRAAVDALLAAIESRDLRRIAAQLTDDATWQNVPHPPAVGREAVLALLGPILTWSDRVEWEVLTTAVVGDDVMVERVDRFWIDGSEHAVRCNGVFTVDPAAERVAAVRDYVDLGEWRARIGPVLAGLTARPATDVIARHLAGVAAGDVAAMAADYAPGATLTRGAEVYRGWSEIAGYFDTVRTRLAGGTTHFGAVDGHRVAWTIERDGTAAASGHDTYTVRDGRIVEQVVTLNTPDF